MTDGTPEGTGPLVDLVPGPQGSQPRLFQALDGIVYFLADDGVSGELLWRTDGTAAGTRRVIDLTPGPYGTVESLDAAGPSLFRVVAGEPWISDGSPSGTVSLGDLFPGTTYSRPAFFVSAHGRYYFSATGPGAGRELWATDGTAAGTAIFADVNPGLGSSNPLDLSLGTDGDLAFSADDGVHGAELWRAAPSGAALLEDIAPGPAGSDPRGFVRSGKLLFFTACDPEHGRELHAVDLYRTGPRPRPLLQSPHPSPLLAH